MSGFGAVRLTVLIPVSTVLEALGFCVRLGKTAKFYTAKKCWTQRPKPEFAGVAAGKAYSPNSPSPSPLSRPELWHFLVLRIVLHARSSSLRFVPWWRQVQQ